jgi:FkbM family methyltransferase
VGGVARNRRVVEGQPVAEARGIVTDISGSPGRPRGLQRAIAGFRKAELRRRTRVVAVREHELRIPRNLGWAFDARGEYYEQNVVYWFEHLLGLRRNPVVYDIGANCGYYTLLAAPAARAVYAFEPIRATYSILLHNIGSNGLANVRGINLALGQASGEARMVCYNSCGNDSLVPRTPVDARAEGLVVRGFENVRVGVLDEVVSNLTLQPPDVMKIDTEGSELPILRGGRRLLSVCRPLIIMEHNDRYARDFGYSLSDVADELKRHDYEVFGLPDAEAGHGHDLTLYQLSDAGAPSIGTVVALPASQVSPAQEDI